MNKKKNSKKWIAILVVSVLLMPVIAWWSAFLGELAYERNTIDYLNRLKGLELPPIEGEPKETDQEEYRNCMESMEESFDIRVFPTEIPEGNVSFFFYKESFKRRYHDTYADRIEIYLSCKYDSQAFYEEVDRIKSIEGIRGGGKVLESKDLFELPCLLLRYNFHARFQYAIMDEKTYSFYYISLAEIGDLSNIVFEEKWAPKKLLKDTDLADKMPFEGRFSIF